MSLFWHCVENVDFYRCNMHSKQTSAVSLLVNQYILISLNNYHFMTQIPGE